MSSKQHKPGEISKTSGQYQQIGPRGGKGPERTVTKGEPFPPTPAKGVTYRMADKTKTR